MLYHFEKGHKAAEAFRDLNELFGEGKIGERQVRRWFERFKSGDTSLEDEEGRDRILMIKLYWMPWKKMKVSLPDYWLRCLMSTNQLSYGFRLLPRHLIKLDHQNSLLPSSSSDVSPDLKRSNHLRTCLSPIFPSPNSSLRSRKASAALCPFSK
uniref:Mos1 transposase HTH domain-containing protein n=1 Tax=Acrobeloides nanus TaxID=290746 RepID=A0A914CU37_9BILA